MQYKVPQNIDKEDQIIGPLTLLQFGYLAIAGAIDFLSYKSLPFLLSLVIIVPLTLIALALAFVKVQDQPLIGFILALFSFARNPKVRVWKKISERPIMKEEAAPKPKPVVVPKKAFDQQKISNITQILDTHGSATPIPPPAPPSPFKNMDVNTNTQKLS